MRWPRSTPPCGAPLRGTASRWVSWARPASARAASAMSSSSVAVRAVSPSLKRTACRTHGPPPFGVLRDLLLGAIGVDQNENPELTRAKISELLVALDPSLVDALPLAHDLLDVSERPSREPARDPVEQERAVAGLLRRLLRARGAAGPFVVYLDDAHWIDPQSERLLAALADVASTTRAFLLLNFRPEFHAAWMGRSYYQQLSVAPLGREATREMINGLLGYDPSVVELGELIRGRTQGNP